MGQSRPWFRFYSEVLEDRRFFEMPAELYRQWTMLLCLTGRNGGTLPPLPDVAFALRLSIEEVERTLATLADDYHLIDRVGDDLEPHNWHGRQFESDTSTPRVQKHRERQREAVSHPPTRNTDVTLQATPPDTEADTETESDPETEGREIASLPREEPVAAIGADAPPSTGPEHRDMTPAEPPPVPTPVPRRGPRYTADFLAFWDAYPAGHKDDKPGTFAEYQKRRPDPLIVAAGLGRWQGSQRWADKVICDAKKFVKEERWHAHPESAADGSKPDGNADSAKRRGAGGAITPVAPASYHAERYEQLRREREQELLRHQAG